MIEGKRYLWSHLKTKTVTVRVSQREDFGAGAIFCVSKLIDIGRGRQTVFLNYVDMPDLDDLRFKKNELAIPFKMGNLDFVYTSRSVPKVQNVSLLLSKLCRQVKLVRIVPEVICPGDLLVFRQEKNSVKIQMAETLRVMKQEICPQSRIGNVL